MSIIEDVGALVKQGKLIERASSLLNIRARNLYVVPDLDAFTRPPFQDTLEGERYAAIAQYFDAFCELNMISVSQNPHQKPADTMLARVHPIEQEFWSMRIVAPEETAGIRVFGAFCAKDSFVALAYEFREHIDDFDAEVAQANDLWNDHFGRTAPFSGNNLNDYLTNYTEF